jgi:hypothetical protein
LLNNWYIMISFPDGCVHHSGMGQRIETTV